MSSDVTENCSSSEESSTSSSTSQTSTIIEDVYELMEKLYTSTDEERCEEPQFVMEINEDNDLGIDVNKDEPDESDSLLGAQYEAMAMQQPAMLTTVLRRDGIIVTEVPDENTKENPIGMLHELCMMRKWLPPAYCTDQEEGLPHERLFIMSCTVESYREFGLGRSKKIAKRQAALKMVERILQIPVQEKKKICLEEDEDDDEEAADTSSRSSSSNKSSGSKNGRGKLSDVHMGLKNALTAGGGRCVEMLKTTPIEDVEEDPIGLVKQLVRENNLEHTAVDVEELSASGKYQCMVQLSTVPVSVCVGSGTTAAEAKKKAYLSLLRYVQCVIGGVAAPESCASTEPS